MRNNREPEYAAVQVEPDLILLDLDMDVRIHLRLDLRKFLARYGIEPQSGEPTPEELQAHVLCCLLQYLRKQAYMVGADIRFNEVNV